MPEKTPTAPRHTAHASPVRWIFLIALGARLGAISRLASSPYLLPASGDMKFYSDWASRIASGAASDPHAFYGLPGYAYFLAAIYWLGDLGLRLVQPLHTFTLGQPHPLPVGILQAVSESCIAVLIFKISQTFFLSEKNLPPGKNSAQEQDIIGILAALGWIFFKPAQTFSIVLMPTTWLVLAFWGCVFLILKTRTGSCWQPWLWIGLLIGVMSMMIATILFIVPLVVVALAMRVAAGKPFSFRTPRIAIASCCVAGGIFAGASPCWIHNFFIAHEPVFLSAHSGINFYIGNNPIANGYPKIPPGMRAGQEGMLKDSITIAENEIRAEAKAGGKTIDRPITRAEVSQHWSKKAHDFTSNHRGEWLRLMLVKFKNFWNTFQYDDLSLITLFSQDWIISPGIGFGLVAALGVPGMLFAAKKYPYSRWVISAVLLHMCALMPVFINERYRLAAAPGLLIMAAFALVQMWREITLSQWSAFVPRVVAIAAMACFTGWRQSDASLWSLDPYNTGIKALDAEDLDRAQENLETAYAYVPQNSEINFALGNLWLEKNDPHRAEIFYRLAISINSRHSSARNNLGVLLISQKRFAEAAHWLTESLQIEPDDGKTWFLLAGVKLELKDNAGALAAVQRAMQLKPHQKKIEELYRQIQKATAL
jgi:Tfp pilus assembly protein PilF